MGKAVPVVKVILDKERTMRLDLNALEAFEDLTGKQMHEMGDKPKVKDLKALVWASLLHEDEQLTIKQVGAMVHVGNLEEMTQAVTELLTKND